MIGPALFVLVFTLEGWSVTGYNSLSTFVSDLSIGKYGWIQIINFIVLGILFLIFARGILKEFKSEKKSLVGPILLLILGISFLLSGPFVTDAINTPISQTTTHGLIHGIFGGIVFLLMPISCFVFWNSLRKDQNWKVFLPWTLMVGIVVTLAIILLTIATKIPAFEGAFANWAGLIQRVALIGYLFWVFTFALENYMQTQKKYV